MPTIENHQEVQVNVCAQRDGRFGARWEMRAVVDLTVRGRGYRGRGGGGDIPVGGGGGEEVPTVGGGES